MKIQKVSQTAFGQKDGNCFPACLATLTGIPLSEFPFPPYVKGNWLRQVDKFLETKNLVYIEWAVTEAFPYFGRCLLIANGMGPRRLHHSIIVEHTIKKGCHTYSLWHDPFSDSEDDGLITWEYVGTVLPKYTANVQ